MGDNKTNILFLVPYPLGRAPSQRYRVEQFLPLLNKHHLTYRIEPFFTASEGELLYTAGNGLKKMINVLRGFARRFSLLLTGLNSYDFVFIHREAAPVGPPIIEWFLRWILRKKIIYDFDDAIWMPDPSSTGRLIQFIKAQWKVKWICRWSHRVVGGNDYLCEYARAFNLSVICIPTVIDMDLPAEKQKVHGTHRVVVGWTGSHSTLRFLDLLAPVLQRLQQELVFDFLVIADKDPRLPLNYYRFQPWSSETEQSDLRQLDIGVMPLTADLWSEGKCGFKLIQYYALGIPALASPVGVNKTMIQSGATGFLCETASDWEGGLRQLIVSVELRAKMGLEGHARMKARYSLAAQQEPYLNLFCQ